MSQQPSKLGRKSETGICWPDLALEGWERRCVSDPTRAPELEELYLSLGFEVKLQSTTPEAFPGDCEACSASCATKIFVFTRNSREQE